MIGDEVLAYVKATANLLDLPLDEARAQRVAGHLARSAALAKLLDDAPLGVDVEIAEVFKPAPFLWQTKRSSGL